MANSMQASSFAAAARPPDKGSFPLDHLGDCKFEKTEYEKCIKENHKLPSRCKHLAVDYMECRMNFGLMAKESLQDIGYSETDKQAPSDYNMPPPKGAPTEKKLYGYAPALTRIELRKAREAKPDP